MERKFNKNLFKTDPELANRVLRKMAKEDQIDPVTKEVKKKEIDEIIYNLEQKFNSSRKWENLYFYEQDIFFNSEEIFENVMKLSTVRDILEDDPDFYEKYWEHKCEELETYIKFNNLQSIVLGISGGLDSGVVAAFAWEVSRRLGIKSIGVSLPIVNSSGEISSADLTGKAWYSPENYITIPLEDAYKATREVLVRAEEENPGIGAQTKIADGNIMARLRMLTLYNVAGVNKGIVLGTGNKTENILGFFTIHGDEPMDFSLLDELYKTEVYRLAEWIKDNVAQTEEQKKALESVICITPTDGLGISSSDLEQIGANSYYEVDRILQHDTWDNIDIEDIPKEVVDKVIKRVRNSRFKQRYVLSNFY